ncbi:transposase [Streptomyces nitrosporeus]|uniref:transposase n=1 Tax=Streptomyces nitrosporeus TaxID=28894 RepID=UPI003320E20C
MVRSRTSLQFAVCMPGKIARRPGPLRQPSADMPGCSRGIPYVLYNDIAWQPLPLEPGFGSGRTCWRRIERRQRAGAFDQPHRVLLARLHAAGELDRSRACADGSRVRAEKGEPTPARRRSTGGRRAANTT